MFPVVCYDLLWSHYVIQRKENRKVLAVFWACYRSCLQETKNCLSALPNKGVFGFSFMEILPLWAHIWRGSITFFWMKRRHFQVKISCPKTPFNACTNFWGCYWPLSRWNYSQMLKKCCSFVLSLWWWNSCSCFSGQAGAAAAMTQAKMSSFLAPKRPAMNAERYTRITKSLVQMCAVDLRPLSVAEGEGFRYEFRMCSCSLRLPEAY